MAALHTFQQSVIVKPKYEQELYRKEGTKHHMDFLNFDKELVIVLDGLCLIDVPLAQILVDHKMTDSALTTVVQELDLTQKPKVIAKIETHEIFGFADLPLETDMPTEKVVANVKRLVIKTDNQTADELSVKLRRNLLQK
jgi:ADP-glucose pyrophosphorylase